MTSICSFSKLQALYWVPEKLTSGEEKLTLTEYKVLKLQRVSGPRGGFIKNRVLIQSFWGTAEGFAFITSS